MKKQNRTTALTAAGDFYTAPVNRKYKDTLFRMIFGEKDVLLSLYNAVNGTSYTDCGQLEIVTLENAIYMNVKNDLAFLLLNRISMYEQQSTFCPNLPLRDLFYITSEYEKLVSDKSLYSGTLVKVPTPSFVVFYNGQAKQPERSVLKLSDAFEIPAENPELELKVTTININPGNNSELLEKCPALKEYMLYVDRVRRYTREWPVEQAVWRAVDECVKEGILAKFLTKYRSEAIRMSIFEYDEEREMKIIKQDIYDAGMADGMTQGLQQGITVGKTQGMQQGLILARLLLEDGRYEDIRQLQDNEELREQLLEEYALESPTPQ